MNTYNEHILVFAEAIQQSFILPDSTTYTQTEESKLSTKLNHYNDPSGAVERRAFA